MLEKQLYQRIKEIEATYRGNTARWMRVENVLLPGVPDVNYCINGAEGWLELKCPPVKTNEQAPKLRPGAGVFCLPQMSTSRTYMTFVGCLSATAPQY